MVVYKGDFLLTGEERFIINEMDSSKMKIFNIDRDVYVEGIGEVLVRMKVDIAKGIKIQLSSFKIDYSNIIFVEKEDLHEIVSIYKFNIEVNEKPAELLLNVILDINDFEEPKYSYLETLNILKDKVEYSLIDDLARYMQNLDLNYILNIIYGGFVIHAYNLMYPTSKNSNIFELTFIKNLEKIGFIIPKPNASVFQQVEVLVDLIESSKEVTPNDMAFVLINTLPSNPLSKPYKIKDLEILYMAIYNVIRNNKGIECL